MMKIFKNFKNRNYYFLPQQQSYRISFVWFSKARIDYFYEYPQNMLLAITRPV